MSGFQLVAGGGAASAEDAARAKAAFGLPRVISTAQWYPQWDAHRQAVSARGSLLAAIWLTVASIVLLAGAAGIIWYGPQQPPGTALSVTERSGVTVCGQVDAVTGGRILLVTAGGVVSVRLADLAGMKPVRSCGGG